jgi:FkbM family methyltransferase
MLWRKAMKKMREFLKRFLPPPVKAFMREVKNILNAITGSKKELKTLIQKLEKEVSINSDRFLKEITGLQKEFTKQNEEIKRLYTLFESANRENLRIYLESKEERNHILTEFFNERQQLREEYGRRLERVSALLEDEKAQNSKLHNMLDEYGQESNKLFEIEQKQGEIIKGISDSIKDISGNVRKLISWVPERYMYNNDYERRVTTSFKEYRERPDYPQKLLALLKGLDDESAATVIKTLTRQEMIWGTEGKPLNILTDEENEQIRYLKQHFYGNILKISDDIYCYRNYLLPINHFEPCVFIYRYGLEKVIDKSRFSDKCIIDAGAFIGDTALILSPLTSSKVYAFEPTSKYFNLLKRTVELNNLINVVPVRAALGANCGRVNINVACSSSSVLKPNIDLEGSEEAELIALDMFVEERGLVVGLIKVDIEGYEQEFLKGAENTIKKQRPTLMISIYHNPNDFFMIKPIIESWNLGYRFEIFKPSDFSISREVLLIAEPSA